MTLLATALRHKAWADLELLGVIGRLDDTSHAKARHQTIRLMNHIYVVDRIFTAHLRGEPHGYSATNTEETPTLEALTHSMGEAHATLLALCNDLTDEALDTPRSFTFTDGDRGTMSAAEMLLHLVSHSGYHRGAVGRILAECDLAPPRDLLTRFLHSSEPERRGH
ncbi:DinB family protein [Aeromonas diversa]|uniref:DinB family protein n=1 Tax=Aeromonas diversa TaxID=502790 RepID=UPI00399F17E8